MSKGNEQHIVRQGSVKHDDIERELFDKRKSTEKKGVFYHHDRKNTKQSQFIDSYNHSRIHISGEFNAIRRNIEDERDKMKSATKLTRLLPNNPEVEVVGDNNIDNDNDNDNDNNNNNNNFRTYNNHNPHDNKKPRQFPSPYPPNYRQRTQSNQNGMNNRYHREIRRAANDPYYAHRYEDGQVGRYDDGDYYYGNSQVVATNPHGLFEQSVLPNYSPEGPHRHYYNDDVWYPYADINQDYYHYYSKPRDEERKEQRQFSKAIPILKPERITNKSIEENVRPHNGHKIEMLPGSRINRIQNQLEYYFSQDNLIKDVHLKGLLDADGWVDSVQIAKFARMKTFGATPEMIIEAAYHSNYIEVKNNKKIRMKEHWEKFIEVSKEEITDIVKLIQKKDRKYKKRREEKRKQRELEKEKPGKGDNDNDNNKDETGKHKQALQELNRKPETSQNGTKRDDAKSQE